jgi:hypothetical protein
MTMAKTPQTTTHRGLGRSLIRRAVEQEKGTPPMRVRTIVLAAVAAASLAPSGAFAGNPDDCFSPITMRSGQGLIVSGDVLNCDGLQANEVTYSPVFPGGAADVFLQGVGAPVSGDRRTSTGSYLEYTATAATGSTSTVRIWLVWEPGEGIAGPIEGAWNSQSLSFGARDSVTAGDMTVVVIDNTTDPVAGTPTTTYTRVFKTATGWVDGV